MGNIKSNLIAPCGMNCGLCLGYIRDKNRCLGCRDRVTIKSCQKCVIKNCTVIKENNWMFCSPKCVKYPCLRLKNLDKRYRTKYNMSMIKNLEYIFKNGIRKFLKKEEDKWKCKNCGGVICVHRGKCLKCK